MAGGNSGFDPCVIVVGDPGSELIREMVRLAREYEVEVVPCDDVYAAVAQAARPVVRRVMIVGVVRELTKEEGRLFPVAAANAARCCCLMEKSTMMGRAALLVALRAGADIAGETCEVRAVLEDWLAGGRPDPRNLLDDDLRATPAELSALLGHETDA